MNAAAVLGGFYLHQIANAAVILRDEVGGERLAAGSRRFAVKVTQQLLNRISLSVNTFFFSISKRKTVYFA